MPTNDSSKRKIILYHCHEASLRGYRLTVEVGVTTLQMPHVCGCVSTFAPTSQQTEEGEEIWKQVDFKFREYHGS